MAQRDLNTNFWRAPLLLALLFAALGAVGAAAQVERPEARLVPAAELHTATNTQAAAKPGPIVLYTTSWCGYCRKTRALLTELGERFEDKDIEKSEAAHKEYQAKGKGYTGIPLIDFDGTLIRGFNEPQLRRLVAERKKRAETQSQPAAAE